MSDHDTADRALVERIEATAKEIRATKYGDRGLRLLMEAIAGQQDDAAAALARRITEGERHAAFREGVCEVLADATPPPVGGVSTGNWSLRTPREIRERLAALVAEEPPPAQEMKRHLISCHAYNNYQPPYEECTCGAEEPPR